MVENIAVQFTEAEIGVKTHRAKRTLVWLGIISIVMLFGGLTSAYIVRQGEGKWVEFALPQLFIVSTVIIVLSSFPMQLAVRAARRNEQGMLKMMLVLTAVLGAGFVLFQYFAWGDLVSQGIYLSGRIKDITTHYTYVPAGSETVASAGDVGNVAASFLYVITGLHVLHLVGGILALTVVLLKALMGKYSGSNYNGVVMCSIYWHFLAVLWVYLFFFLLYIR